MAPERSQTTSLPKLLFAHPTGNANCRSALEGLCDASLLMQFHTAVAVFPGNHWSILARTPIGAGFERRAFTEKARLITKERPLRELARMVAGKAGLKSLTKHETGPFCVDAIYRDLDRSVAKYVEKHRPAGVYAYEDGAFETFRAAKRRNIKCFYDLPIGYWQAARKFLDEERRRWPEWASTMTGLSDSNDKLARKDEELRLADHIFVASEFTKSTLEHYTESLAPIEVIPYGYTAVGESRAYTLLGKRKLKLLFVGGLSQRKGIADVFAVAAVLKKDVELTVVGGRPDVACPALDAVLKRHRWIPSLPHTEIIRLMRDHDALLFPSLFEGFGLVITEAMSQGTPVITTDRTAGPDLIEHGVNGWLIEAGSTEALLQQVELLLDRPDRIAEVGENARQTAARRPWSTYGQELAGRVRECLKSDPLNARSVSSPS